MKNAFTFEKRKDGIGIVYFDLPGEKVNKFSTPVMEELEKLCDKLATKDLKCLLFLSKKERIFIAGADITEFSDVTDPDAGYQVGLRGQSIFQKISKFPFPTIAVINGACMGGGTELALACTYRCATDSPATKIALPEVNLGILPGWGGTQRLPKLIGLQRSLDVILSGRNFDAKGAYRSALIDKIITSEWMLDNAIAFANEIINGKTAYYQERRKPKGPLSLLEKTALGRKIIFSQTEKMVLKKSGGHYPAPLRALKVIKETYTLPLEKGFDIEARALGDLVVSPISKNLVQIFFWTEEIKKENGSKKKTTKPLPVVKAGVLGAGVMGGGIAQLFAAKQIETRVKDVNHLAVTKAYQQAANVLKEKVQRRRMTTEEYRQIMLRISGTTDYSGFKSMDLVVEAIVEDLKIKKIVLAELEEHISDKCIVASNTSSLLIDDMAAAMKHKKRFVGMHFFNPVHRMPLVEVIRGKATSDEAVATIFDLCKKTGKTPIVVNDGPGFLVNRLLLPYMVESVSLLEEGHSIQTLDSAMKKFGMPMGPIELFDEVGIDVAYKVAKILQQSMSDRMAESDLLDKLVKENRLGKKNGIGFYKYDGRKKVYDSAVEKFITVKAKSDLSLEQLSQRMVYPMINEAARCLEDKIALNARDVDIGMIFGTGFAPFRGGLLKYGDTEGLGKIIDTLGVFEKQFGRRFKPADYLIKIKDNQGAFYK